MDWDNSYFTMSDENNYTIWAFLKKLFNDDKIYRGSDVVPWSGRSGTSYSQMEIIEGRKLVAHTSVFIRFPLKNKENEYLFCENNENKVFLKLKIKLPFFSVILIISFNALSKLSA